MRVLCQLGDNNLVTDLPQCLGHIYPSKLCHEWCPDAQELILALAKLDRLYKSTAHISKPASGAADDVLVISSFKTLPDVTFLGVDFELARSIDCCLKRFWWHFGLSNAANRCITVHQIWIKCASTLHQRCITSTATLHLLICCPPYFSKAISNTYQT